MENVIVHPAGQPQPRNAHGGVEQLGAQVGKGIAPPVKATAPDALPSITSPNPTSVSTSTRNGRSMAGSGRSGALCRPPAKAVSFMSSPPVLLLYAMLLLAIRILS